MQNPIPARDPARLNWPEAKPVAEPTTEEKPTTTGRGLLGNSKDKNKSTAENDGNKVQVKKSSRITCFDDFDALKGKKEGKPVLIFIYWPNRTNSEGKPSKIYDECQKLIEVLARSDVRQALTAMDCYKVNYESLDKERKKRYRVKGAPTLLFIDATGKVLKRITSPRIIETVAKTSDKNLRKVKKKREKEEEKNK
ncbi:MAG: hypothetical protein ACYS8W_20330 [Planctomycetota bacterium]